MRGDRYDYDDGYGGGRGRGRGGYGDRDGYGRGGRGRGRGRGPSSFISEAPRRDVIPNWDTRTDAFEGMNLKQDLVDGLYQYGFKHPSEIQSIAIQPIVEGRTVIAQAQSGTGKTGAFGVGILNRVDVDVRATQALIIAPTRELVEQIYEFLRAIGERVKGLTLALFRGGTSVFDDQQIAVTGPHVVVATPGRACHLIVENSLNISGLQIVCLDEADRVLDISFREPLQDIMLRVPKTVQILLFSATYSGPAMDMAQEMLEGRDPANIFVRHEKLTLEGITQYHVNLGMGGTGLKWGTLLDLYQNMTILKAVIFANRRQLVDELVHNFTASGFNIGAIHGDMEQAERDRVMKEFRTGKMRVLVATDILARGIDVQQITLVINYELPHDCENYIHRIGRSGRYGRKGVAINLCDGREMEQIKQLEAHYATQIPELPGDFSDVIRQANDSAE